MPTLPDNQIGQLNVAMSEANSSMPNILDGLTKPTNGNPHQSPSRLQNKFSESYPIFRDPIELNKVAGQNPGLQPNSGHPVLSLPFKRKAIIERPQDNRGPQKMSGPNKRVAQVSPYATSPSVSHILAPKKIPSKASTSSSKVVQIKPITNEARSNAMKKTVQSQVSPKGQTESRESVRAKLRESLASALALVSQDQKSCSDGKMKMENEDKSTLDCPSSNGVAPLESPMELKSRVSSIPSVTSECNVDDKTSLSFYAGEIFGEVSQTEIFLGVDFQCNSVLPGDDSLFSSGLYFKDDFLQGNGLSWESDLNLHDPKVKETENGVKPEPMNEDLTSGVKAKMIQSPESVAHAIESELYKLFGGVNKKYKEKGRSLLFNLKDSNNPELRERVMSGELPPNRLCSMTAEELASKELSQWRIAKAEELDHMKVLPETDINMRRLVKKTHKGEYQVDFEPDGGAMEEVPVEINVTPSKRSKIDKFDGKASRKADQTKTDQCAITIPSDGADMQGLMGDDLNDLPPVISLDEFMESLNQDPPFENLPVDSMTTRGESEKENVQLGSRSLSPVKSPKYPLNKISPEKVEVKKESPKTDGENKLTATVKQLDTNSVVQLDKQECVWEGQLQFNLSSMANFMAVYKRLGDYLHLSDIIHYWVLMLNCFSLIIDFS